MRTKNIESVISIAKEFGCLPSEVMSIKDEYTSYCFNEACLNVLMRIKNEEKPNYITMKHGKEEQKTFSNFTDFYNTIK